MNTNRKIAIIVGVLFIIAFVFDLLAMAISEPILNAPDYLVNAYPNKIQIIIGSLLELFAALAIILIPIMLFPILKQHNESLSFGYVGFRFLEGILFIFSVIKSLSLISLSQEFISAGAPDASYFQTIGNSIQAQNHWSTLIYIIVFTLGALMFYSLLYKSKLLPRFISAWGLVAVSFLLAGALFGLFGLIHTSKIMIFFGPPVALNEMTLSIWLFAKGFNPSAIASGAA
jgi:hypothetical protein